jgi:hypothetical protein
VPTHQIILSVEKVHFLLQFLWSLYHQKEHFPVPSSVHQKEYLLFSMENMPSNGAFCTSHGAYLKRSIFYFPWSICLAFKRSIFSTSHEHFIFPIGKILSKYHKEHFLYRLYWYGGVTVLLPRAGLYGSNLECAGKSPPWAVSLCPHYQAVGYRQPNDNSA